MAEEEAPNQDRDSGVGARLQTCVCLSSQEVVDYIIWQQILDPSVSLYEQKQTGQQNHILFLHLP